MTDAEKISSLTFRNKQLREALRACVDQLANSPKWEDRHGTAITTARKIIEQTRKAA